MKAGKSSDPVFVAVEDGEIGGFAVFCPCVFNSYFIVVLDNAADHELGSVAATLEPHPTT